MPRTKLTRSEQHQNNADFISAGDLNMSMFWFGDLNVWGAFPTAPTVYQKPRSQVFYVTRNWFERSVFLKAMTFLKFDVFNYGFKLQAVNPPGTGATKAELKEWNDRNDRIQNWHQNNKLAVLKLLQDAWQEWFVQDNCIAIWAKDMQPVIYPVEHLTYDDSFGIEVIRFAHGIRPERINQLPSIPIETRKVLAAGDDLTLMKQGNVATNQLFDFATIKRTKTGMGLAWPQLRTLFNTVGMWESLEMGDWQLADACRTIYELHKIGHEIKNGPRAGLPDHFWKKKRADNVNKLIKPNKELLATIKRLVVQFDHTVEYPRPDPKHFSQERYAGPLERMMIWAMPLAQMVFGETMNPWHGNFLKAKAKSERDTMGAFIETILRRAMGAPKGATCVWSDDLFVDPRLMMDTLKTGLTAGPLSQGTFLEKTGHSPQHERARKEEENDLPPHQVRPIFDAAHGVDPSDPEAGRPAGSRDKGKRAAKGRG